MIILASFVASLLDHIARAVRHHQYALLVLQALTYQETLAISVVLMQHLQQIAYNAHTLEVRHCVPFVRLTSLSMG